MCPVRKEKEGAGDIKIFPATRRPTVCGREGVGRSVRNSDGRATEREREIEMERDPTAMMDDFRRRGEVGIFRAWLLCHL